MVCRSRSADEGAAPPSLAPTPPLIGRTARAVVLALTVLTLFAGCGSGGSDPGDAQPVPGGATFGPGKFDELPRYPRSEEAGTRTEKDGTVAQSFFARDAVPEQVLDFYVQRLDGWTVVEAPAKTGTTSYRGIWSRDDWKLVVSAAPAPGAEDPDAPSPETVTQYSLTLTQLP